MYQISIKNADNSTQTFEVQKNQDKKYTLDNQLFDYDFIKIQEHIYHVIYQHKSFEVMVLKTDFENKSFRLKINQSIVQVEAKNKFDLLLEKMGMQKGAKNKINDLKAPMPGAILAIKITEGQAVKKGDPLLILEAMKMENIIKAPADVVIKTIKIALKETVEKNQVLMLFE